MHKGQKSIQILWDHQKNINLVENYKECSICAILRGKTSFWDIHRGYKKCCAWSGALKMLPRGTKKNGNPSGLSEKMFIFYKVCDFVGKVEISFFREVGWVPSKKCSFWCSGPSIRAPQIPLGHQKKLFWRYFYRIWRY